MEGLLKYNSQVLV